MNTQSTQSWYVGVDPGTSRTIGTAGQLCFLNEDWNDAFFIPTWDFESIRSKLKELKQNILFAVVEEVSAHFGRPHGDCQRHLERFEWLGIRHAAVPPVRWQTILEEHQKKKMGANVKPSVEFIQARHPELVRFIKKEKAGYDSNKSDALVLAMYAEKLFKRK